jgi:cytochrome c5
MSDAHNEHESVIKTPKQLIAAIIAALLVPIVCIVLLVQYVTGNPKVGAGSNGQTQEAIAARIAPVASQGFTLVDVNAPKQLQTGEAVYKATCIACHATGAAGSPKFGDAVAWAPRIAQGYDTLLAHALGGFKVMPPKGGNPTLDNVEVGRAIVYMANHGGANFKEPEVTTPAAPATAPAVDAHADSPAASVTPAAPAAPATPAPPAPAAAK